MYLGKPILHKDNNPGSHIPRFQPSSGTCEMWDLRYDISLLLKLPDHYPYIYSFNAHQTHMWCFIDSPSSSVGEIEAQWRGSGALNSGRIWIQPCSAKSHTLIIESTAVIP